MFFYGQIEILPRYIMSVVTMKFFEINKIGNFQTSILTASNENNILLEYISRRVRK